MSDATWRIEETLLKNLYPQYATHLPLLARVLAVTAGPVLELGSGKFSTPFIMTAIGAGRRFLSLENRLSWYEGLVKRLPKPCRDHEIRYAGPDWRLAMERVQKEGGIWEVAFMDIEPGSMRAPLIDEFLLDIPFVIVHDVGHDTNLKRTSSYGWEKVLTKFKAGRHLTWMSPHTGIYSNIYSMDTLSVLFPYTSPAPWLV